MLLLHEQEKRLPDHMTAAAVTELIEAPHGGSILGIRDRAIFELFYATGIRVSELVGMNRDDLDLDGGLVRVLGKGRKERIVPFGTKALEALTAYLECAGNLLRNAADRA